MPTPVLPYGEWPSPITPDLITSDTVGLGAPHCDGQNIYWLEGRPAEKGRTVLVRRAPTGETLDLTPPGMNVRSRVHEYGGGAYLVADGSVYFVNFTDQRLYRQDSLGGSAEPISPDVPAQALRYADMVLDRSRHRLVCIREDHTDEAEQPRNTIVSIDLRTSTQTILAEGCDFYASPRLSPDGMRLAWLSWNHPNMPWDGTDLWVAEVRPDGTLSPAEHVAGGATESVCQPVWAPNGVLYFASDRSDWWNIYAQRDSQIVPVYPRNAEFGEPAWSFGQATYAFADAHTIICAHTPESGAHIGQLVRIDISTGRSAPLADPFSFVDKLQVCAGSALLMAGWANRPSAIVRIDLDTGSLTTLKTASELHLNADYVSIPQAITFPTTHGLVAHAFYYPPHNDDVQPPADQLPPLIVISHGGPTAAASSALNLNVQFYTSRGFAVLDVNYGGSTGYGRAYRQRLNGQWGIVDVDDCCNAASFLAEQHLADPTRMIIKGGSAGGFTTLAALTFRRVFRAGASYFGVSDLEALARDTHKFESRYTDSLVGPYPAERELYVARSPIHAIDQLSCPIIFFQGLDDPIVPPNQAEMMVNALREKGIPVAYLTFAGESHGFRRAESIKRCLQAELSFYGQIFGFAPADDIEPILIDNL